MGDGSDCMSSNDLMMDCTTLFSLEEYDVDAPPLFMESIESNSNGGELTDGLLIVFSKYDVSWRLAR